MALSTYKEKRNFKESPEPTGGKPDSDKLRFVIQKHHASRLHYDFRLEVDGVLKSWAVPKGPSTDPDVKRLAMMVEDHPYDYRNFEGIIPSGYGAGTVIIWDEGFYEPVEAEGLNKKTLNKNLSRGIQSGKLHVILHGKKLKGEYALVKTHGKAENAWLLFKVKDKYVSKDDITLKDKSVISKKTLAQVKATSTNIFGEKKEMSESVPEKKETSTRLNGTESKSKKKEPSRKKVVPEETLPGRATKFPLKILPMLATSVDKPFDLEGWQYEIKWDGYRTLAFCNKNKIELKSRNDKSFNEKFLPIHKALLELNLQAVLDGEIVVLDKEGKPDFGALQNWRKPTDGEIFYYVFDLLWMNGKDLTQLPLRERRIFLKKIMPENSIVRLSENFEVSGIELYDTAEKIGLEGIMAKKSDSLYNPGIRTRDWLKIKANKRQEMVIGGYTKNEDSSKSFSSLLLGVYEGEKLVYTGKVGTGFSDKEQIEMLKKFKPFITKIPPFAEKPDIRKPSPFQPKPTNATAVWLKPELVCEVRYTEMTKDGVMRHPAFEAMRIDKNAKDVSQEKIIETQEMIYKKEVAPKKVVKSSQSKVRKTLLTSEEKMEVLEINGHEIKFNNLSKIYWPEEKITKRDMLNYYYQIAPYILPYLKDRPQSMNRHPNGINRESFYFKDVTDTAPDWVETFNYKSETDDQLKKYLVAKDDASLLYMATLGCIEMNPWHSRVESEDNPDWCVIDLDPGKNTFQQVIDAANVTREILESMGVTSYPKTSGSTGIHVYIPLGAKYTYAQSREFARVVATLVQREIPDYTTIERMVKSRKGKMYIDFLQNRPQATIAAPYSLRPKAGATVSMPLHWDEVKKGLKMSDFTIYNALERIQSAGDIFKPVLGRGMNMEKAVKAFENGSE